MRERIKMNEVKLKIHKLGIIEESEELILNRFMIFSGESGLGKSYVSILCHYIFTVLLDPVRISTYFSTLNIDAEKISSDLKSGVATMTVDKRSFEKWLSSDALVWLSYMVRASHIDGAISISLPSNVPAKIEIKISEDLTGIKDKIETYKNYEIDGLIYKVKDTNSMAEESPFAFILRHYLIQQIYGTFTSLQETYVLPPSRGTMLTEDVDPLTGMYIEFKKAIQQMLVAKSGRLEIPSILSRLINQVLDGHVERKEGQYIYTTNGVEMPLSAAAASVRELASLEFLINNTDITTTSLMIDEPEAHLHPLKQRMMADILSCMIELGSFIQVTTHSDYFLRRINELVLKYRVMEKCEKSDMISAYKNTCKEINENPDIVLNPRMVSAYLLRRTADNHSVIVKQNLENGIPFSSFHQALDASIKNKLSLEEVLNDEDD